MHALQDIGEQLVELDLKRLNGAQLTGSANECDNRGQEDSSTLSAVRRQMQLIGKLMRDVDASPIQEKLGLLNGISQQQAARLHLLERWRNRLLADERSLTEFGQSNPGADLQRLRSLMRNASSERLAGKPPRSFRLLFQELQRIIPQTPEAGGAGRTGRTEEE